MGGVVSEPWAACEVVREHRCVRVEVGVDCFGRMGKRWDRHQWDVGFSRPIGSGKDINEGRDTV